MNGVYLDVYGDKTRKYMYKNLSVIVLEYIQKYFKNMLINYSCKWRRVCLNDQSERKNTQNDTFKR